jgi:DNA-directed RNA polymerase specialized sigma24 family protein
MDFEARMEARDLIRKGLAVLTDREQAMLVDRALHAMLEREISKEMGVTTSRAHQIYHRGLGKARAHLRFEHGVRFRFDRDHWQLFFDPGYVYRFIKKYS